MLLKYEEMKPPPLKFIMNPTINLKNGLLNECENNTLFFALFTFSLLTFSLLLLCTVRLNLINHVLALFHDKFACNIALRNLVFRWESCKGSV